MVVTADPSAANLNGLGNLAFDTRLRLAGRVGHTPGLGADVGAVVPTVVVGTTVVVGGVVGVTVVGGTGVVVETVVAAPGRHWE